MRIAVAILTLAAGLLLGGCQVAVPGVGTAGAADLGRAERRSEQATAVDGALRWLTAQGAVTYRIPAGNAVLTLSVTSNGIARGDFPIAGEPVQVVRADGALYLTAPVAYWRSQGMDVTRAGEYAARWVRADSARISLDPGKALIPAAAAQSLRTGLAAANQLADPTRQVLPDGTEVFDVDAGAGRFQVTTSQPYRLVSADAPLLSRALDARGLVYVDGLTTDRLARLRVDVEGVAAKLGQPFVAGAAVTVVVTDNRLTCGTSGACTDTVQVRNTLAGDTAGSQVRLVLTASVTADGLGTRTCGRATVVAPNTTTQLACSVRFQLPRTTGSARVVALPAVGGEVLAQVDGAALQGKVRAGFAALGG